MDLHGFWRKIYWTQHLRKKHGVYELCGGGLLVMAMFVVVVRSLVALCVRVDGMGRRRW
jgi:hypothetical protein